MIGSFFSTRKTKKNVHVRASFRPCLESLEERVALDASLAAPFQALATQAASSTPATGNATSNQTTSTPTLANLATDMVNVATAAQALMTSGSTSNSTTSTAALAAYMSALTTLFSDITALYQSSSLAVISPPSYIPGNTGGNVSPYGALTPLASSSQTSLSGLSNSSSSSSTGGSLLPSGTLTPLPSSSQTSQSSPSNGSALLSF